MYGNNPYQRNLNMNQQSLYEQIDNEINNLQQMKEKMKNNTMALQQPSINQTFQLAPTNREVIKYATSLEEVQRDIVIGDTPYFSKDMSVVWVKSLNGNIKTYELSEIVPKDEKDIQIEFLQNQIEELRKEMRKNDGNVTNAITTKDSTDTKWNDDTARESTKENKSTSIQRVQTSKKRQ